MLRHWATLETNHHDPPPHDRVREGRAQARGRAQVGHRRERYEALIRFLCSALGMLAISSCTPGASQAPTPADAFMENLQKLCGKAFAGGLVSKDEADADIAGQEMVMHVRTCEADVVRIPFHVGEDRSRTWVVSRPDQGLRLKHDHRHEDGHEDAVTQYGGDAGGINSKTRIEFPVDDYSIALFEREGLTASVTNVWALELTDEIFAYELRRANRNFRVEFDLSTPVSAPPPPWGAS